MTAILLSCTFGTADHEPVCVSGREKKTKKKNLYLVLGKTHFTETEKWDIKKDRKEEEGEVSVLRGIHQRDGGGMPGINLSHAFSVLLTFSSSSPKRRVMCQRAFIKADRRAKQCGGNSRGEGVQKKTAALLRGDVSTGYHREGASRCGK